MFTYLTEEMYDDEQEQLPDHYGNCKAFLDNAMETQGTVLVHWYALDTSYYVSWFVGFLLCFVETLRFFKHFPVPDTHIYTVYMFYFIVTNNTAHIIIYLFLLQFLCALCWPLNSPTHTHTYSNAGRSRSASIALAYVMHKKRWPLQRALEHLQKTRPTAQPNKNFMEQLKKIETNISAMS